MTLKNFCNKVAKHVIFELAKMGYMREGFSIVRHKNNTSNEKSPNGNWETYWEKKHPSHHFPIEPHKCPSCLEFRSKFVGSHILANEITYITPICKHCNDKYKGEKARGHYFYVKDEDMVRVP